MQTHRRFGLFPQLCYAVGMRLCEVYQCGLKHQARGYCSNHYNLFNRYDSPFGSSRPRGGHRSYRQKNRLCEVYQCGLPHVGRGFCNKHWANFYKTGSPFGNGRPRGSPRKEKVARTLNRTASGKLQYAHDRRKEKADYIAEYKLERGCLDCDLQPELSWILEFDHLPQYEKLFDMAKATRYSWDRIHAEIAKCEVVCGNCHKVRSYNRNYSDEKTLEAV